MGADEEMEHETARSRMEALIAAMRRPKEDGADGGERQGDGAEENDDRLAEIARRAVHWPVGDASGSGGPPGAGTEEPRHLERGAVVGRYMVLRELGAGGMGVVYAAYDPELDRKVALKVVAPGLMGEEGRTRLLREAQALAKLSHRNVVAIHDVGTMGEQVWLAMELLRGQTLREWLRERRDWREVLGVMRKAGRGLAAAHAAGLLHRDFKPENVMVGRKGGVKVMDFGLARARGQVELLASDDPEESMQGAVPVVDTLAMGVTQAGTVMGTPHYMAPEQLVGGEVTAAVDQYALCVTLWEGLYGERPFAGGVLEEIVGEMIAGKLREPSRGRAVPGWLRRVCERGLSVRPQERFASMEALLDALEKERTRSWVRKGLAAVGVLAVIGVGVAGYRRIDEARRVAACKASGDEVEEVWNDSRKEALHAAILATGVSYAPTTARNVMPRLDRQADAWREARVEACLDAEVRGTWSAETLDRSQWCLDERKMELESLVDALISADAGVVQKAVMAATALGSVEACRKDDVLRDQASPPEQDIEAIRPVKRSLARAGSLLRSGRYDEGLDVSRSALEAAEHLGWTPLVAKARLGLGAVLQEKGAYADAERMLEDAYFEAAEGVDPDVAVAAATRLVLLVGSVSGRYEEGRRWGRHAEVALSSVRDGVELRTAMLLGNLARAHADAGSYQDAIESGNRSLAMVQEALGAEHPNVAIALDFLAEFHLGAGHHEEARVLSERALFIFDVALGSEHPRVAQSLATTADIHEAMGSYDEAKRLQESALLIREKALGRNHPDVAHSLNSLVAILAATGAYRDAIELQERAVGIFEEKLGREHPDTALGLGNLASLRSIVGDTEEAKALYERALAIQERKLKHPHPSMVYPLMGLANVHSSTGAHEDARALYERALAIQEATLGPRHPDVAITLYNLANVRHATGANGEARVLYERALALQEETLDSAHADLALPLIGLAELALEDRRLVDAISQAERAVTILESSEAALDRLSDARFLLARALWPAPPDGGRDRARAVALARQARDAFREIGPGRAKDLADVEQWLHRVDSGTAGAEKK